jgi:DNA polymerase I-like protein with 3'-5' exonuclease and polymerase domains
VDLVFDIETDAVEATKVWCIVAYDINTEKIYSFGPDELDAGVSFLTKATKLIGHNIVGFDVPMIKKFFNVDLAETATLVDTLVLSRLFNPTREGGHALAGWGYRLGHPKGDFKEFTEYSKEMLQYCINDVVVNAKVFQHLKQESKGFSAQSVEIEHKVAALVDAQRKHGFLLDMKATTILQAELEDELSSVMAEVRKEFKPKAEVFTLRIAYNANGTVSKFANCRELKKRVRLDDDEYDQMCEHKKIKRVIRTDFNLGSRQQIGQYLQEFGWKPKKFTPTGQPVVDESTLKKIKNIPQAQLIARYLMLQKRIGMVASWLKEVEDDNRVHGYVNHNGAVTGRMTHRSPNTAQIVSSNSEYGKECRTCWTVPEGKKLVGIDASGLELRMLAHYLDDEEYTNEIINGDIHTHNQRIAGLESRSQGKTFIYALLYGAGDPKLGTVVGGGRDVGAKLRKLFFDNLPAFKALKDRVGRASKKGYIKALDGRKLIVRSQHAALNTLLQGAGAIVMKRALILFTEYTKHLDAHVVANVHDEWQVESAADVAEEVGKMGVKAIKDAGLSFNLACPLDGEYKVGDNWYDTH